MLELGEYVWTRDCFNQSAQGKPRNHVSKEDNCNIALVGDHLNRQTEPSY
jgi:hypothetical protein